MGIFSDWHCCLNKLTPMALTVIEISIESGPDFSVFLFFKQKAVLSAETAKMVFLQLLIKHDSKGV